MVEARFGIETNIILSLKGGEILSNEKLCNIIACAMSFYLIDQTKFFPRKKNKIRCIV